MNYTGLYPKDRVISLTQASLTSTLELKGPPLGGHGQMWRLRPESIPIDTGALGGGWGTQAPGGRARTWGHLKKFSLKGVGARVPPARWRGAGSCPGWAPGLLGGPGGLAQANEPGLLEGPRES